MIREIIIPIYQIETTGKSNRFDYPLKNAFKSTTSNKRVFKVSANVSKKKIVKQILYI